MKYKKQRGQRRKIKNLLFDIKQITPFADTSDTYLMSAITVIMQLQAKTIVVLLNVKIISHWYAMTPLLCK